jgi:hypothetical protein
MNTYCQQLMHSHFTMTYLSFRFTSHNIKKYFKVNKAWGHGLDLSGYDLVVKNGKKCLFPSKDENIFSVWMTARASQKEPFCSSPPINSVWISSSTQLARFCYPCWWNANSRNCSVFFRPEILDKILTLLAYFHWNQQQVTTYLSALKHVVLIPNAKNYAYRISIKPFGFFKHRKMSCCYVRANRLYFTRMKHICDKDWKAHASSRGMEDMLQKQRHVRNAQWGGQKMALSFSYKTKTRMRAILQHAHVLSRLACCCYSSADEKRV